MHLRERVLSAMRRQVPDALPWEIRFAESVRKDLETNRGIKNIEEYFTLPLRTVYFRSVNKPEPFEEYQKDLSLLKNPQGWELGDWGVGQLPGGFHHFVRLVHPLDGIEDPAVLEDYPFPDMGEPSRHEHMKDLVPSIKEQNLAAVGYMEWTVYEMSWYMRGMDKLLMDIVLNPGFATLLLDRVTEEREKQARLMASYGVDIIRMGDDIGGQDALIMSPEMWREWLKPRLARVVSAAKSENPDVLVSYHSDGKIDELIPELIGIGIDILNPVQPECMDLESLKREYGRDLSFWGGVGTQTTMPFGTPDDVRKAVRWLAETIGKGGGLLLAPNNAIEPEVPWDNIMALKEAVESL